MTRTELAQTARAWLGTPFVHQAARRGVGTDCIGLVGGVARDFGLPDGLAWDADKRFHAYARTPDSRTLLAGVSEYLDRISVADVSVGDVLLMRFYEEPQHFAILWRIDPPYIVHASSKRGRVVEHRLDDKWRSRVVRAYRYRGLS